ncbi:hypothetical protein HBI26_162010 [Parastagonospora nodorum]|nr:hypothetical protein HBI73_146890 [Parastagonospora nodorum]KAH5420944.1 hypothetical protein HBI46_081220 [Parastagonospora nodorum]KAH5569158.1 hypothetical protein HBI26_162010 [Parastagonospora nodorum]
MAQLPSMKSPIQPQILDHLSVQPRLPYAPFSTNSQDVKSPCRYYPYVFFLDRISTRGGEASLRTDSLVQPCAELGMRRS